MANSPKKAGLDARQRLGWWYSNRFLILRRASQLLILGLFLLGPLFSWWLKNDSSRPVAVLRGNYSSSMLFDAIPLTDPLMLLQSMASGYWPAMSALIGGVIVALFYALLASRLFCSWVCPLNVVTDFSAWMRRKLGMRNTLSISRNLRYGFLLAIIVGSAISGTLLWEWLNPITTLGRGLINGLSQGVWPLEFLLSGLLFGFGAGIWLIVAIFLFDLLVVEHGWCGHLCPLGAMYGAIGCKSVLRISAEKRQECTHCMDCFNVCPEPQVLRGPLFGKEQSPLVLSKDCISCGRCIDVCAEKIFQIKTRFYRSGAKE